MISQNVTLSLKRFGVAPVIHAVQNDTGREVVARFTDLELVAGMTGKLSFTRSDGTHYEHTAVIDTTAQTVTAELDQALTQDGQTRCQIKITDADGIQSAFTFIVDVQPDMAGLSQEQDGWRVEEITDRLDAVEDAIDSTIAFTVSLPFSGWSDNTQTVSNANFVASGFSYIVSASPDDLADYSESAIYADDVTVDGRMTFHCEGEPTTDIVANITRLKVG